MISRSKRIKRNVWLIFCTRAVSVLITFALMRVSYDYLDQMSYGVWLTILTIVGWIGYFDIGLGHGLRNKLSIALAHQQYQQGKAFVSTSYLMVAIFISALYLVFVISFFFMDWTILFLGQNSMASFQLFLYILILIYLIHFFFSLIIQVAMAHHDAYIPGLIALVANMFILATILLLPDRGVANIYYIGLTYALVSLAIMGIGSLLLYNKRYQRVKPSIATIERKHMKQLFSLSIRFFVIQIATLIIFSSDNLIITIFLGPEEVVPYQVSFKLFALFIMIHSIVLTPLWSAFTEAYEKQELAWMRQIMRRLLLLLFPFAIAILLLILLAKPIIRIWMGEPLVEQSLLIILMGAYTLLLLYHNMFSYFLNGIGKLNMQLVGLIIGAIINVPLSILLAVYAGLGLAGIVFGSLLSLLPVSIMMSIQAYKLLQLEKEPELADQIQASE